MTTFYTFLKWLYIGFVTCRFTVFAIKNCPIEQISHNLEDLGLTIFQKYIDVKYSLIKQSNKLYNNYWIVRFSIGSFKHLYGIFLSFIRKYIYNAHTEPIYNEWISICRLTKEPMCGEPIFKYLESYYDIHNSADYMIDKILDILITGNNNNLDVENLLVMKSLEGKYIYFIIKKGDNQLLNITKNDYKPVKSPFLTIEYSHPSMHKRIPIDLNKNDFLKNNQILSPLFIKRYLEYHYKPYFFDLDYRIHIMDKNIKMFDIGSSQYIEITDRDYIVKTI